MTEKISYIENKGKYLIAKPDGKPLVLRSKKEFNEYLTKNNCEAED